MAQSLSNFTNTIPFSKPSNPNKCFGHYYCYGRCPEIGLVRTRNRGVKAMAADRREYLHHLQRPGIKRREAPSTTPIGLWERFPTTKTVQQMMEAMERMVEEPIARNNTWPSSLPNDGNGYMRGRTPWEVKEGEAEYKMRFDMPGMTKEDVKIWVEEKMLVIKAEKVAKKKDEQENGTMGEDEEGDWSAKSYGKYSSRIVLPENVDFEKIKAEVRDGVLYVTIPKVSSGNKIFEINVQ